MLYAVSVVGLLLGHLLLGVAMLRAHDFPRWSRRVPLGIALALPLLVLARAPGSPLLSLGDIAGYLLLEGIGVVFGSGWIALGLALRSAEPVKR